MNNSRSSLSHIVSVTILLLLACSRPTPAATDAPMPTPTRPIAATVTPSPTPTAMRIGTLTPAPTESVATAATPSTAPTAARTAAATPGPSPAADLSLTETHVFAGFDFSIDYPSGWVTTTLGALSAISELAADDAKAVAEGDDALEGYVVAHSHSHSGLPEDPSLEDLLSYWAEFLGWTQTIRTSETEVFGVSALRATTVDEFGNWVNFLTGFLDGESFLLTISAPTEAALTEIMPTWNTMLETIRPAKVASQSSATSSVDLANGRVGWWPGDGDANNTVGPDHGTLGGGASFAPGVVGEAFSFDGADDFVVIPGSADLRTADHEYSVALWINPAPRVGNPDVTIIRKGKGCGEPGWGLDFLDFSTGNAHLYFTAGDGAMHSWAILSPHMLASSWYFVVVTVDGQRARIYVDGQLSEDRPIDQATDIDTLDPISVGANKGRCGEYHNFFNGLIDEIMIYNRALNKAEIQVLFDAGRR